MSASTSDMCYGPMKHRTRPLRTTPDPKILGDGIDQTPQRTGDPDTLSQRQLCPDLLYSQGVKYTLLHQTPKPSKVT